MIYVHREREEERKEKGRNSGEGEKEKEGESEIDFNWCRFTQCPMLVPFLYAVFCYRLSTWLLPTRPLCFVD